MSISTPILSGILLVALLILNHSENRSCGSDGVASSVSHTGHLPELDGINQPLFHRGSGRRTPCTS